MTLRDEYFLDEMPPAVPRHEPEPVQLERRGITQQIHQHLLWSKATIHKNTVAAKLREAARPDDALKLEACHTSYTFAICKKCAVVSKFPNRCDNFFCPECQPRLSQDRKKAVEWWTHEVTQPKHVVLTVQNVPVLTAGHVREFRKWFTRLRRSKFARHWIGGFYSIEVTNEGRGWHLHMHCLIDAKWIDSFGLSAAWSKATNGLGRIVKVKDARKTDYLAEVTKYVVKGVMLAAWPKQDIVTFIDAFRGVRTFGVFGSLYGKRTEFREWWKFIRDSKPVCNCGCSDMHYLSELEFIEMDLRADPTPQAIPPPRPDLTLSLNLGM
jgi:hypothetical protein